MTSSDGYCSALTFAPGELGTVHQPAAASVSARNTPAPISVGRPTSAASTPVPTPTSGTTPAVPRQTSTNQTSVPASASPSPFNSFAGGTGGIASWVGSAHSGSHRPASPARSMSASSIATEASFARVPDQNAAPQMNNPTPSLGSVPSLMASAGSMPLVTPPQTPGVSMQLPQAGKREAESGGEEQGGGKKRRIAPTRVMDSDGVDVSDTKKEDGGSAS